MADQRAGDGLEQADRIASRVALGPNATDADEERTPESRSFSAADAGAGV
jgi:hypothetical protein